MFLTFMILGLALTGFQIDGAKTFFSPQNMKNGSESCLLEHYSKKSILQWHPFVNRPLLRFQSWCQKDHP